MNIQRLSEYELWCLKKLKLSKGTTKCYINNIKYTQDFDLNTPYETATKIFNDKIQHAPSKSAHVSYIQFLKSKETTFEKKQYAVMLQNDIKDIRIEKKKCNLVDETQDMILTKDDISTYYDFVEHLKVRHRKNKPDVIYPLIIRLHNLIFLRISYESSGRPEEIRRYDFPNINYDKKEIQVSKTITKRNKSRVAEISEKTVELIKQYEELHIKEFGKRKKLFYNFKNYKAVYSFVVLFGKLSLNKHVTPYFFKHSFMTHKTVDAMRNGVHEAIIIEDLKNYVRHSSSKTTKRYVTIANRFRQKRILERYGEVP